MDTSATPASASSAQPSDDLSQFRLAICVGGRVFSLLTRVGVVSHAVCREYADLAQRVAAPCEDEPGPASYAVVV
jgi:hypothetical protein